MTGQHAVVSSMDTTHLVPPKRVSFSTLQFHFHPIVVGDNPAVSSGPPLTISWTAFQSIIVRIEEYERLNPDGPRLANEFFLSSNHRVNILTKIGYSKEEVREAAVLARRGRSQRIQTNHQYKWDQTHAKLESITRVLHNLSTFGRYKRREKEFLDAFMTTPSSLPHGNHHHPHSDPRHITASSSRRWSSDATKILNETILIDDDSQKSATSKSNSETVR